MNEKLVAAGGPLRYARWRVGLLVFGLLLLGFLLVQTSSTGSRSAAQETPITFAVIGDFGSGSTNERDVANLVKGWNPSFIITVGDNNYPDGEAATIDKTIGQFYHDFIYPYAGSYGAGATTNRFWPAVGNHDWDNKTGAPLSPYLSYFTLPGKERYYDFVRGPIHFFVIDSDSREPDGYKSTSVQAQWLQTQLAIAAEPWKIVVLHHGPYSSRTSYTNLQWPYREWGADAVFNGHAHVYERVLKDGFPYVTNGLGGESLGSFDTAVEGSMVRYGSDYGAMRVTVTSTTLSFQFITRRGAVIDSYSLSHNAAVPNAPTSLSAMTVSPSQINLAWTDNATNEDGFQVEQSPDGVNFARIATVGPNINAYSNISLQPATVYYYRVRAFIADQGSAYTNTASATTTLGAPLAPSNLTAAAVSNSQINLSWIDNSSSESGFLVERCVGASCTNFAEIAETAANANGYSNTGLAANTTYRYRVRAFNDSGDSGYTNETQATTTVSATKPAAPSNLSATAISVGYIDLAWADNSSNETGFKVYRSLDGVNFTRIVTTAADVTGYTDTGRAANTKFYYYVRSTNSFGDSANSNTAAATTFPTATTTPAAPTNLAASAPSSNQVTLTWTDNSTDEKAFKVYRSTDAATYTDIVHPGPNSTSYTDTGRAANTTYYYKVRAYNDAGSSAYSNTVSVKTP
ncbi:MAG TPA: fibronectin type III domain-containing protein [Pyrinomonadaceae bacterium]|jgi:hypothetical protein